MSQLEAVAAQGFEPQLIMGEEATGRETL